MIRESDLTFLQSVEITDSVRVVNTEGESRRTAVSSLAQTIVEDYEGLEVDGEYKTINEVIGDLKREADGTDSDLGELTETVRGISQDLGSLTQTVSGLSAEIETIFNIMHPIGSYHQTSAAPDAFNPNTAWGGTWELLGEGQVLLSGSTSGDFIVGNQYGENTHILTVDELPSHNHSNLYWNETSGGSVSLANPAGSGAFKLTWGNAAQDTNKIVTGLSGNGQAHNNMQLSTACYIWHRTA